VQWDMKDCTKEWKVLLIPKKVPNSKQEVEGGPSRQSTIPSTNTGKETNSTKETKGSTTIKNPRNKNTIHVGCMG
jgi:hypothetical protein